MKKLLFLASSLSILLLASCSNDIQKEEHNNSLYTFPTNGKETFVVIQNQTLKDFERILKTETTYKEIVAKYIKDKKAQGKTVIIPRDHKDYKIDMNALKTYNSNPFKKVMNKKSGSWEANFQITKDGILQDKKLYDLDKNFSPADYDPIKNTFYSEVSPGVTGTDYTEDCELYAVGDYCFHVYCPNMIIDTGDLATRIKAIYQDVKQKDEGLGVTRMPHIWEAAASMTAVTEKTKDAPSAKPWRKEKSAGADMTVICGSGLN